VRYIGVDVVEASASADQQHELPAHVTFLADAVRLRDLDEREGLRDLEREAAGLDQLADLSERMDRAAGVPAAEGHSVLPRASEVGDRHNVLRAASTLLINGASGSVGSAAVQLAVVRGARVIGTASPANHEYLRSLGAEPVAYGEGLVERVRALAPQGVDGALDVAGSGVLPQLIELAAASVSSRQACWSASRTPTVRAWPWTPADEPSPGPVLRNAP
jgi:hypothetical protein